MSGFNNSGSLVNGPTYDPANGGSIVFDGVDDLVNCGNNSSIQIIGDMSILAWIKVIDFTNYNGIAGKTASNGVPNPYDYYLFQSSGLPSFLRGNGSGYVTSTATNPPSIGVWQHIAVTMLGTQVIHYLNGSSNGVGTISIATTNGADNLMIGNRTDNIIDFKGNISIVQMYNRALSTQEVFQNFNVQKSRFGL
jgi:hypothetical protein